MNILICGSRDWDDKHPIYLTLAGWGHLLAEDEMLTVINGGAKGADSIGAEMAEMLSANVITVPADWDKYGKSAGPIRNQQMLDEHEIDAVYAFRLPGRSRGTDDMIERAKSAGIPTYVISPA